MRRSLPIFIGLLTWTAAEVQAVSTGPQRLPMEPAPNRSEMSRDRGVGDARADTTWYGDYQLIGGEYYARSAVNNKASVMWTFDRGNGPTGDPNVLENGEGWRTVDLTVNTVHYFRVIDNTLQLCNGALPPIIDGAKSLWVGADYGQGSAFCWSSPCGYGNNWCQRISTPVMAYNGSGSVTLSFKYFNQSEPCYDGTQVILRRADSTELLLNPWQSACAANPAWVGHGGFTDSIGSWQPPGGVHPGPAVFTRPVTQAEIGAAQHIQFIVEFKSDTGSSDEDGYYQTIWGPFGMDDVTISGGGIDVSYNFEGGLGGWTPLFCTPIGSYAGVVDVGCYTILDPCHCKLSGNVMKFHADFCDEGVHPVGQDEWIVSPICDDSANHSLKTIFLEYDMYWDCPQENGVMIRPGWSYYPWTCELTHAVGWSPRVGQRAFNYNGGPVCGTFRAVTTLGTPVPPNAQKVKAIFEILSSCSSFAITNCSGVTNFTPILDNLAVGIAAGHSAPIIESTLGGQWQDVGSYPSSLFDPRAAGPINVSLAPYYQDPTKPDYGGDSLVIVGPAVGNDPNMRWESRMWWRVTRRAPFQSDKANGSNTIYKQWKDAVSKGFAIDRPYRPQFTWGLMDSVQMGPARLTNKFLSNFREDDPSYSAAGEATHRREMLWDDVFYPGTQIQYFFTSDYVVTPNSYYFMPDTSGGNFYTVGILPGCRTANVPNCGGTGFNFCVYHPATLYIDLLGDPSVRFVVENALKTILNGLPPCNEPNGVGCTIPWDRNWDYWLYHNAGSSFETAFARGAIAGSNAGMTLDETIGYRAILLTTGPAGTGFTRDVDYQLYGNWLISQNCNANTNRQVFIMNGDKCGELLSHVGPYGQAFLSNTLGATLFCEAFNGNVSNPNCAPVDSTYCLRYLPVQGGPFSTDTDVDAYGNWCPNQYGFNVYNTSGTGVGNRIFQDEPPGTKQGFYAQVANANLAPSANYKTVIDGVSWHHLTQRNPNGSGTTFCPRDTPSIIQGVLSEIGADLKWGFDSPNYAGIPKLTNGRDLASCEGTWTIPSGVDGDGSSGLLVNRLYQNEPNPFNQRSTIQFALAQNGPVQVLIYDVNGRLVRTLVDRRMEAGQHREVWDGTNNLGRRVGSGVFWAQMKAGSFVSNKKMIILK